MTSGEAFAVGHQAQARQAHGCSGREPREWLKHAYQVRQLVKYFVDLLAVHEPNVRLSHEAPHLLPDVILIYLGSQMRT